MRLVRPLNGYVRVCIRFLPIRVQQYFSLLFSQAGLATIPGILFRFRRRLVLIFQRAFSVCSKGLCERFHGLALPANLAQGNGLERVAFQHVNRVVFFYLLCRSVLPCRQVIFPNFPLALFGNSLSVRRRNGRKGEREGSGSFRVPVPVGSSFQRE